MPTLQRTFLMLLLPLALLAAADSTAQVFKWTDKDGKVHYGDSPPAEATTKQITVGVQSFGGPAEVDYVSILKRPIKSGAAASRADVVIYSASWCGPCKSAKTWMTSQNIPFTDYDVETNEQGKRNFQAMGARGVPTILVGEQRMTGFSAGNLSAMLKKGGY